MVHPLVHAITIGLGIGALLIGLIQLRSVTQSLTDPQHHHGHSPHPSPSSNRRRRRRNVQLPYEACADDKCTICLEKIDSNCLRIECGHRFHFTCMEEYFRHGYKECPNCRQQTDLQL